MNRRGFLMGSAAVVASAALPAVASIAPAPLVVKISADATQFETYIRAMLLKIGEAMAVPFDQLTEDFKRADYSAAQMHMTLAARDPRVSAIFLDFNSAGGEVAGNWGRQ